MSRYLGQDIECHLPVGRWGAVEGLCSGQRRDRISCARCCRSLLLLAATWLASSISLPAAELQQEFVEGLRKQGLGDMGMQYLRQLETTQKIPASMAETFDLELARCMQVAAQQSENVDEAERLRVDTRGQLEKFLKDHATHPQAGFAFDTYGVLSLSIGNTSLKQASFQKDPKRKDLLLTQARAAFEEARPRFAEAAKLFKDRYDVLTQSVEETGGRKSAKARLSKKRQARELALAEDDWLNSRFNLAMVDYHVAQTYADPKHADVKPLLDQADKSLDAIWQGYRGLLPGLLAHYWTGRVNELLGNFDKALDIYDEVTGNEAEEGRALNPALAGFYAENFLQRAKLLNQLDRRKDLIYEAEAWLDDNSQRKTDPYYGVVVEVAKAYFALSEDRPAAAPDAKPLNEAEQKKAEDDKVKTMNKVVRGLRDIIKVSSSSQNEAILLYRKYAKAGGGEPTEIATFDEAVAIADAAASNREFQEAVKAYERAIELQEQEKNPDRLASVQYHLALAKLQTGDSAGSFAIADAVARANPTAKLGPPSAVLAINAALALCSTGTDRAAAEQQLGEIVDYTIQTWPNRAESDDARIALGRLKTVQNDLPGAITAYEKVNSASDRFAQSQNLSGQSHWRMYLLAKQAKAVDDAATHHRTAAQGLFEQALAAALKSTNAADEAVAAECRLYLGEMFLEGNQPQLAIEQLAILETKIRESNPQALDMPQLRTLVASVRAHAMNKNMDGAKASGELLMQLGQDIPQVNLVLTTVARLLREAYKGDVARVIESASKTTDEITAAQAALEQSKAALADFLTKLAARQQLSLPELVAIGDSASEAGQKDLAKVTYQRILAAGQEAAGKDPKAAQALIRVQAALIGLLRTDRQYQEALNQVDALILSVPNALDPKIERARILQGLAEDDPTKFAEATSEWAKLRAAFQRSAKKPPAYYEIIYNTAKCLEGQSRFAPDAKAEAEFKKQANQLLKATLAMSPALNGPDMVAQFHTLLQELK